MDCNIATMKAYGDISKAMYNDTMLYDTDKLSSFHGLVPREPYPPIPSINIPEYNRFRYLSMFNHVDKMAGQPHPNSTYKENVTDMYRDINKLVNDSSRKDIYSFTLSKSMIVQGNHTSSRYICDVCDNRFMNPYALRRHYVRKHISPPYRPNVLHDDIPIGSSLENGNAGETHKSGLYTCNHCIAVFDQKTPLREHLLTHNNERPHSCDNCGRRFSLKQNLMMHVKTHNAKLTRRVHSTSMTPQINFVSGEFICDFCGRSFARMRFLRRHERVHMLPGQRRKTIFGGIPKFDCPTCCKVFPTSPFLQDHVCKGSAIPEFRRRIIQCDMCTKKFTSLSNLRRHRALAHKLPTEHIAAPFSHLITSHLGDKIGKVPIRANGKPSTDFTGILPGCFDIGGNQVEAIDLTRKSSIDFERTATCNVCKQSFNSKAGLMHHLPDHREEYPYKCDSCVTLFKTPSQLISHCSLLHPTMMQFPMRPLGNPDMVPGSALRNCAMPQYPFNQLFSAYDVMFQKALVKKPSDNNNSINLQNEKLSEEDIVRQIDELKERENHYPIGTLTDEKKQRCLPFPSKPIPMSGPSLSQQIARKKLAQAKHHLIAKYVNSQEKNVNLREKILKLKSNINCPSIPCKTCNRTFRFKHILTQHMKDCAIDRPVTSSLRSQDEGFIKELNGKSCAPMMNGNRQVIDTKLRNISEQNISPFGPAPNPFTSFASAVPTPSIMPTVSMPLMPSFPPSNLPYLHRPPMIPPMGIGMFQGKTVRQILDMVYGRGNSLFSPMLNQMMMKNQSYLQRMPNDPSMLLKFPASSGSMQDRKFNQQKREHRRNPEYYPPDGSKPFECNLCLQRFRRKCHLARHMIIHSEGRQYRAFPCRICNREFTSQSSLYMHRRKVHSISFVNGFGGYSSNAASTPYSGETKKEPKEAPQLQYDNSSPKRQLNSPPICQYNQSPSPRIQFPPTPTSRVAFSTPSPTRLHFSQSSPTVTNFNHVPSLTLPFSHAATLPTPFTPVPSLPPTLLPGTHFPRLPLLTFPTSMQCRIPLS